MNNENLEFSIKLLENEDLYTKINKIEFLTIINYINMYIKPNMKIIEFNATTGRYSRYLCSKGYKVEAVEAYPENLKLFKKLKMPNRRLKIHTYQLEDYSNLPDNSYDMVLLIHSFKNEYDDKKKTQIYKEAYRVAKPGGFIYSVYQLSDMAIMKNGFSTEYFKEAIADEFLTEDIFDFETSINTIFNFYRKENIDELLNQFNLIRLNYVSLDLLSKSFLDEQINQMDKETFKLYFKYFLSVCERKDMVGLSDYVLDISQKKK